MQDDTNDELKTDNLIACKAHAAVLQRWWSSDESSMTEEMSDRLFDAALCSSCRRKAADAFESPELLTLGLSLDTPALMAVRDQRLTEQGDLMLDTNLPRSLPTLIGRADEVTDVVGRLRRHDVSILTITGPCGAGKRLFSWHVASHLRADFKDGIWVIDCADYDQRRGQGVTEYLISILPPQLAGHDTDKLETFEACIENVRTRLYGRRILIVITNFDPLVSTCYRALAAAVHRCQGVKVLLTSGVCPRVPAEACYRIKPLACPPDNEDLELVELLEYPAIELFVRRARDAQRGFTQNEHTMNIVRAVCKDYQGLPQALEIIAGRIRWDRPLHSKKDVDRQLGIKLVPTIDSEHGVDWIIGHSMRDLESPERALLYQLSIFAGSFSLDSAEKVACAMRPPQSGGDTLANQIASLVRASLLEPVDTGQDPRYMMLKTIKDHCRQHFADDDPAQKDALIERYLNYYMLLAQSDLGGDDQYETLQSLNQERDNLRKALRLWIDRDPRQGLKMAGYLWRFWELRSSYAEGYHWLSKARAASRPGEPTRQTYCSQDLGSWQTAVGLGRFLTLRGKTAQAKQCFVEVMQFESMLDHEQVLAWAKLYYGSLLSYFGGPGLAGCDYDAAEELLNDSLRIWDRQRDAWSGRGLALIYLGRLFHLRDKWSMAVDTLRQGLQLTRMVNHKYASALAMFFLGEAYFSGRQKDMAREWYDKAKRLSESTGHEVGIGYASYGLGMLALEEEQLSEARMALLKALQVHRKYALWWKTPFILEGHARLAFKQKNYVLAAQLLDAADAQRQRIHTPRPLADSGRLRAMETDIHNALQEQFKTVKMESPFRDSDVTAVLQQVESRLCPPARLALRVVANHA